MAVAYETFEVSAGTGRLEVSIQCVRCKEGLIVSLLGGELPHVGGVVLAAPRAHQKKNGRYEDVWDIPVPGHLDTIAALPVARELCRHSGLPVSVTAGIHVDEATKLELDQLLLNCNRALVQLLELLGKTKGG